MKSAEGMKNAEGVMGERSMNSEELSVQVAALKETMAMLMKEMKMQSINIEESLLSLEARNDINLEERVQALEFEMANVQDEVTSIDQEVMDLEENVETQITIIEGQITVLSEDQVNQDEKIEDLEGLTEGLVVSDFEMNSSIMDLDSRVTTLESLNGTD